ncbi:hypothetical protein, partial [Plasmodium yoelii yoelii]
MIFEFTNLNALINKLISYFEGVRVQVLELHFGKLVFWIR